MELKFLDATLNITQSTVLIVDDSAVSVPSVAV